MAARPPRPRRTGRARLAALGGLVALAAAAACSEQLDGGAGCTRNASGDLCPLTNAAIVDTTIDPVVLDTALGGVPVPGDVGALLLAVRPGGDSLDVRAVVRFDSIPARFSPPAGGDSAAITSVQGTALRLSLDTTGTRLTSAVTVEAYDVDTAASDTVAAVLAGLFRPDRRLGAVTLAAGTVAGDTLSVPLSNAVLAAKAQSGGRLRVGLRLVGSAAAQVRVFGVGASGVTPVSPLLSFDPATDTTVRPIQLFPSSVTPGSAQLALAYRTQTVVARSPRLPDGTDLVVGGLPARRTYLRFAVPARFTDSVNVVRAELLLTQRSSGAADALDTSVTVQPAVGFATDAVSDVVRASELVAAIVAGRAIESRSFNPVGSGVRAFPIANVIAAWGVLPANTPRALVLRSTREGAQAAEVRFYSTEAPAGLRPRLRLSYVPRTNFGLP